MQEGYVPCALRALVVAGVLLQLALFTVPVSAQPLVHDDGQLQQQPNSCALAALSYALNFSYAANTSEQQLAELAADYYAGSKSAPPPLGYSIADVQRLSARLGVNASVWQLPLSQIHRVSLPALFWLAEAGQSHVVVLTQLARGSVRVFDPAVGHRWLGSSLFADRWLAGGQRGIAIELAVN